MNDKGLERAIEICQERIGYSGSKSRAGSRKGQALKALGKRRKAEGVAREQRKRNRAR